MPILANENVSLLIGMDTYDLILSRDVIKGPPKSPKEINILSGWTIAVRTSAPPTNYTTDQLPTTPTN